ncbi:MULTISPECIES: ABC transporter permease [Erwinia]|jgi:peptide/nickel transport system permease protein|uniref:ABC transporter permease n=1 Tax=Erwinia TaxID=551 RepID=UPI000CFEE1C5|nr:MULTISPECIES: ABC transporter permease [Erwinia]PRB60499.1 ABC transporter permease [Erwinia billingiae]QBR52347.1 ABC transporter permease [Erwinia sp. QL-Z3]
MSVISLTGKPVPARAGWVRQFCRHGGAVFGAVIVLLILLAAIGAPWIYPTDPLRIVAVPEIWPFTDGHFPLGTDSMGRDMTALLFHGARATLLIGLSASLAATLIGVSVGASAAWFGGWVDEGLMRVAELFQIIPNVVFVLTVVSVLGPQMINIIIAVGLVSWQPIARLTRAEFLSYKEREFVLACRASGMSAFNIVTKEILPNVMPPVIVLASLVVAGAILYESVIAFLGLGDPNLASWGRLVGEGRTLIRSSWYICAVPGVAIMLTVLALNLIGDGLNDAFNPKLRARS